MLSCRSLFSVDRLLKFSSNYVKSRPPNCFQGHYYYNFSCNQKMGGARHKAGPMGRTKKQKTFNPVWRPVCTQASVSEETLVKDVMIESEDGSQIQEVHCGISTDVSDPHNVTTVVEVANEVTDSNCSSGTLYGKVEERALEGESVPSAGKHSRSVEIGASVIRFITGKDGSMQKKIEEEMGVKIIIPSSKKEYSIIVEGDSSENITRATEKIQAIIDEAVKSPQLDYSHFVSLPLAIHPELVDKLVHFQNSILGINDASVAEIVDSDSNEEDFDREDKDEQLGNIPRVAVELKARDENDDVKVDITSIPLVSYAPKASPSSSLTDLGIDKSIFIKPKTFHLTVLMLKLWNKERVSAAAEVLKNISSKVMDALDNRPIFIRLKGLDCMRGSLAKAQVLYTPVEEIGDGDRLMRACQVIIDAFNEAGLVLEKDSKQKLKLHATVMNARHRKRKKRTKKFDSFDARGIFKQFGSEEWGEYLIREAHLSQRFMFDENGYYHCCASIPFPENMQVD